MPHWRNVGRLVNNRIKLKGLGIDPEFIPNDNLTMYGHAMPGGPYDHQQYASYINIRNSARAGLPIRESVNCDDFYWTLDRI